MSGLFYTANKPQMETFFGKLLLINQGLTW